MNLQQQKTRLLLIPLLILSIVLGYTACSDDEGSGPGGNGEGGIFDYRKGVGSSANHLLSDARFSHLIVELWFVDDYEPTNDAIDAYETFLHERLNKSTIEVRKTGNIDPDDENVRDEYSTSDIVRLEDAYRREFPREDTMTAFMVFLNGNSDKDDGNSRILGIAYYNTSMAIFQETIEDLSDDTGITAPRRNRIEKIVMNHEMGHILGLVDIGSPMQEDHRDEDHGAHCDNDECLMYYTMKRDDLVSVLLGSPDPELDQNCINDLRANGGK